MPTRILRSVIPYISATGSQHDPRGSYRKEGYPLSKCGRCGTEAHCRLKYVLGKNVVGERV